MDKAWTIYSTVRGSRPVQYTTFDNSFPLLEKPPQFFRELRRALRHALWSPAFCTGTHFLSASSQEIAPSRRRAMSARLHARWTFGAIWEGERTELGRV